MTTNHNVQDNSEDGKSHLEILPNAEIFYLNTSDLDSLVRCLLPLMKVWAKCLNAQSVAIHVEVLKAKEETQMKFASHNPQDVDWS